MSSKLKETRTSARKTSRKKKTGDSIVRVEGTFGVYFGEMNGWRKHGHGVWYGIAKLSGQRYEGGWMDGMRHGSGLFSWADGDRYYGEYKEGKRHGRGAFRFGDCKRFFDGVWAEDRPWQGTVLDSDGTFYHAELDGRTLIWGAWGPGAVPENWRRLGALVDGKVGAAFGEAEWTGAVALEDKTQFEGSWRGLCPLRGVTTDAAGKRVAVTYAGQLTLGERPSPLSKQVPLVSTQHVVSSPVVRVGTPWVPSFWAMLPAAPGCNAQTSCTHFTNHKSPDRAR